MSEGADKPASGHRDTPPEDVIAVHGRSPGSRVVTAVWAFPALWAPVTINRLRLAAYSCGGSSGLARWGAPGSLLAPNLAIQGP
jgi:hypothetical protein